MRLRGPTIRDPFIAPGDPYSMRFQLWKSNYRAVLTAQVIYTPALYYHFMPFLTRIVCDYHVTPPVNVTTET